MEKCVLAEIRLQDKELELERCCWGREVGKGPGQGLASQRGLRPQQVLAAAQVSGRGHPSFLQTTLRPRTAGQVVRRPRSGVQTALPVFVR